MQPKVCLRLIRPHHLLPIQHWTAANFLQLTAEFRRHELEVFTKPLEKRMYSLVQKL